MQLLVAGKLARVFGKLAIKKEQKCACVCVCDHCLPSELFVGVCATSWVVGVVCR